MKRRSIATGLLAILAVLFSLNLNAQVNAQFTALEDTLCVGDTLHLIDQSTGTIVSWEWRVYHPWIGGYTSYYIQNPSIPLYSSGSYSIQLTVFGNLGDSSTLHKNLFIYVSPPAFSAGIDQSICQGQPVQLGVAGQNISNPQWSPSTGLSCANCDTTTAFPMSSTQYVLTAIDSFGCLGTDTVIVGVNSPPVITSSSQTICEGPGNNIMLSSTGNGSWSGPGVSSSGYFQSTIAGLGVHTLYNSNSCGIDSVEITVLPKPVVSAGPAFTICAGDSVQLQGAGSGLDSIQWGGPSLSCTDCYQPYVIPPVGTHVYLLTAYGSNGCNTDDTTVVTVISSVSILNTVAFCTSSQDYQFSASPAGGIWSGSSITSTGLFSPSSAGVGNHTIYYSVNTPSCSLIDSTTVTVFAPPTVDAGTSTTFCVGDTLILVPNITSINPVGVQYNLNGITIGNGPMLSYLITDTTSLQLLTVYVTDSTTNCTSSDTVTIFVNNPAFTISATEDSCGNGNGTATVLPLSGQAPYSIAWSTGDTTLTVTGLAAGQYNFTFTKYPGCSATGTVDIMAYPFGGFSAYSTTCDTVNLNGTVLSGPSQNFIFLWDTDLNVLQDSVPNTIGIISGSGNYTLTISDLNGCSNTFSSYIQTPNCIWPGDANFDGIANNQDVLNIGIAFGTQNTWYGRNASLNWVPQFGWNWPGTFSTGVNYKHADTDGDSIITYADTIAISLNYGLTHFKYFNNGRATDPPLFVDQPDSLVAGDTVVADIIFGDTINMVSNAYGVAFTIQYDPELIDSGSVHLLNAPSWMGSLGNNMMKFSKDRYSNGEIDVTYVRTDQVNTGGWGKIGTLHYILQDDISGKDMAVRPLILTVTNIKAITYDESVVDVFGKADTAIIYLGFEGIPGVDEWKDLMIYPVPSFGEDVFFRSNSIIDEIEIYDLQGRSLEMIQIGSSSGSISVEGYNKGVYLLRFSGRERVGFRKMILAN